MSNKSQFQVSRSVISERSKIMYLILACLVTLVAGHGRLRDPPARSSAWRDGFNTPQNYNDNELFCGGFTKQHIINGGKCGICGDPWEQKEPRDNELGGMYGTGVITRTYKKGQVIDTWIELTQNHLGWYELRLCPLKGDGKDATQECLNSHILEKADGTGTKVKVPATKFEFRVQMKLPNDVVCDHCTLQWDYWTGNKWDICEDGSGKLGCGAQETFRGCADIKIVE